MPKYYQPLLPYFDELEREEIAKNYQDRLWRRWFGYYKKCRNPEKKSKIIDQYNKIFYLYKGEYRGRERG